ncbi:M15 family metallopeptidase [Mucisphaera calidilacus]|uniref:D-alanyl-D-alanine dipeptidase n=1 Tax=Mucisphaera calidilacus TaxID=2527982 RepID=A0A518C184_9BACT|nr:M15 family metallopeptidase [Mucisphaera calidilacus]QDU72985.1 D-alanyl-D-alanine dipeptidase [Mucisphaera calidilacus]
MSQRLTFEFARPVDEVLAEARRASVPVESGLAEPDLVELRALIPELRYGLQYSSIEYFTGGEAPVLRHAPAQRVVAEALAAAAAALRELGYGVVIHDAYRPWWMTYVFWHVVPEELHHFVANPERGSMHNRGLALDVSLLDLASGALCVMPSGVDELSPRAFSDYAGGPEGPRRRRDCLRSAMVGAGFESLDSEWWHYTLRVDPLYPLMNVPVEDVGK